MNQKKYDNSFVLNYTQNDNHPLIPNQNTYYKQNKLITINSTDRNIIKYPDSSTFEILLPTDIVNVATVQLKNWMFPTVFDTFSPKNNNLQLEFTILPLTEQGMNSVKFDYDNPGNGLFDVPSGYIPIVNAAVGNVTFIITIDDGTYNDSGLANEIQNKMNIVVNNRIIEYINDSGLSMTDYIPYSFFNIILNQAQNKYWFVNTLNPFIFNNDSMLYKVNNLIGETFLPCSLEKFYPSFSYFGLPAYLGFKNIETPSLVCNDKYQLTLSSISTLPNTIAQPSFSQCVSSGQYINVNYIKPEYKYSLIKDSYILIDIETLNGSDETKPFTNNEFTKTTNQGNGSVNSFLGRIPLVATTNTLSSSTGGGDYQPITNFNPPLERLRKFKISIRYHDGSLVDFGLNEWMFSVNVESYIPSHNVKITQTPF
jgi:hypothetical protein